jgi:hypothetical protein
MLLFNLLILFLVIALSYVFKITETKKYDTQLVFILLVFAVLVIYKTLNYVYNKRMNINAVRRIAETFATSDSKLNDFIADTLSDREKILALEDKVKQYEEVYGTNQILNNDLENKIKYAEDSLRKLSDQYIIDLENATPEGEGVQIALEASEEDITVSETPELSSGTVDTDAVKNIILKFLESISRDYE